MKRMLLPLLMLAGLGLALLRPDWVRIHLPAPLLEKGPHDLLWWQWLALPVLAVAAWSLGHLAGWVSQAGLKRLAGRTAIAWDDVLASRLGGPLALAWSLLALRALLPLLGLGGMEETLLDGVRAALFIVFFWGLLRGLDVAQHAVGGSSWVRARPGLSALLPLGWRLLRVGVAAIGVVSVLSAFGYPVAGIITGLGIGGLALALAFQKTGENLFGSISLGIDQPCRVGDFVKVEDFVGTVDAIGLRSTRFRTLDRTIITIPNGKLADMRIENFAPRDRLRLSCTVGLVYGTTAAQMRQVLEGLEAVLRGHPKIWPEAVVVKLGALGASSLDIEVMAWFMTPEWSEFQAIRQEMLLRFLEVVERAGTSFAYPTQTIHLQSR